MRININFLMILILAIPLAGCDNKEQQEETSGLADNTSLTAHQKQLADLRTGNLEVKLITSVVSCTGEVEVPPQGMASVTAPLGGYIVRTGMVPGTQVRKGTLLATLSNPQYVILQQNYLETAGELKFAEQNYNRQKLLDEQNATAVKKFQESESSYNVLKARLSGLREQLRMIGVDLKNLEGGNIQTEVSLRSPITGFVTTVNNHPGQFVEPQEVIFEIVDMSDLHLHLNVFEQDITSVKKGQTVRFRPAGGGNYDFSGSVSLVSPKKNMDARTFDVHGHIEKGEDLLKPGMYVEAEILISDDSVLALPEKAIVFDQNKPLVITDEDGMYTEHTVETGARMDGWVEIRNYEELWGKKIVTDGATRLFTALRR